MGITLSQYITELLEDQNKITIQLKFSYREDIMQKSRLN